MTSQKLYDTLTFLDALDNKLKLQGNLESIASALVNLVGQPATPSYQSQLATSLASFEAGAAELNNRITPSQYDIIKAMGGEEFFDPLIAEKVKAAVQTNAMTPSVAQEFVQKLATRRAEFLNTVRTAKQSLEKLNIKATTLQPGAADLSFLIPRDIFDNELGKFAKELIFIDRLLQHLNEALTGEAKPVELEQLASSVPTIALAAGVPLIGTLAWAVDKFLDSWKKIEEIREIRAKLAKIGLKASALDELTEQIDTTVDEVVEETTQVVLVKYQGPEGRKHELENAVRQDTRRLFGQIERGLTLEFHATPKKDGDAEEQKALTDIVELARTMHFPQIAQQPMLLKGDEVVEGEIRTVKHLKKTVTRKTSVAKKAPATEATDVE